uniref:Hes family bHLH transcription factor 3 n=1 Tax=Salvator merianae TaxID=96440 RepID=A0A8D0ATY8_SALMN
MGSEPRSQERGNLSSFRKVSKPLMEKKRRARINLSLEQLKALLEKNYSHQIRKRKLEKADILELSVKYVKSLQHSVQASPVVKSADYQAGFRSCLQGVHQFLLRSEAGSKTSSFQLLQQLSQMLPTGAYRGSPGFSTTDSDPQATFSEAGPWATPAPGHRKGRPVQACGSGGGIASWEGLRQAGRPQSPGGHTQGTPQPGPQLWRPW